MNGSLFKRCPNCGHQIYDYDIYADNKVLISCGFCAYCGANVEGVEVTSEYIHKCDDDSFFIGDEMYDRRDSMTFEKLSKIIEEYKISHDVILLYTRENYVESEILVAYYIPYINTMILSRGDEPSFLREIQKSFSKIYPDS